MNNCIWASYTKLVIFCSSNTDVHLLHVHILVTVIFSQFLAAPHFLNCVVLVSKLLFIVLCDRNEHQRHVSHQEIICLWNRIFLFVFNYSQRDVCLILSLPITLLRLCVRACLCVCACIQWLPGVWTLRRSLLCCHYCLSGARSTSVCVTANDPAVAPHRSCRELDEVIEGTGTCKRGESSITAEFRIDFHIEAFRKIDGVPLLKDWINISLTGQAGQFIISGPGMLDLDGKCLPPLFPPLFFNVSVFNLLELLGQNVSSVLFFFPPLSFYLQWSAERWHFIDTLEPTLHPSARSGFGIN